MLACEKAKSLYFFLFYKNNLYLDVFKRNDNVVDAVRCLALPLVIIAVALADKVRHDHRGKVADNRRSGQHIGEKADNNRLIVELAAFRNHAADGVINLVVVFNFNIIIEPGNVASITLAFVVGVNRDHRHSVIFNINNNSTFYIICSMLVKNQ